MYSARTDVHMYKKEGEREREREKRERAREKESKRNVKNREGNKEKWTTNEGLSLAYTHTQIHSPSSR